MFAPLLADAFSLWQSTADVLAQVFGGDVPREPLSLQQIAARGVVVYVLGLLIVRFGKSRMLSRTTSLDLILGVTLGSLLSRGVTGHASISGTAVASIAMVAVHWIFTALACRWHGFGTFIKGNATLVVADGVPQERALRHSHISPHDLLEQLRMRGVGEIADVAQAYKERNGEVSVIKRKSPPRVVEVGVRDGVQTVRIELS